MSLGPPLPLLSGPGHAFPSIQLDPQSMLLRTVSASNPTRTCVWHPRFVSFFCSRRQRDKRDRSLCGRCGTLPTRRSTPSSTHDDGDAAHDVWPCRRLWGCACATVGTRFVSTLLLRCSSCFTDAFLSSYLEHMNPMTLALFVARSPKSTQSLAGSRDGCISRHEQPSWAHGSWPRRGHVLPLPCPWPLCSRVPEHPGLPIWPRPRPWRLRRFRSSGRGSPWSRWSGVWTPPRQSSRSLIAWTSVTSDYEMRTLHAWTAWRLPITSRRWIYQALVFNASLPGCSGGDCPL